MESKIVICSECGKKFTAPKSTGASQCRRCWMFIGYLTGVVSEEEWQAFLKKEE